MIKNIVEELKDELTGGIISKVQQPDEKTIVLKIFVRVAEKKCLISTHPGFSRLHLTTGRPVNPPRPPRFCAFLRSRITNALVEEIAQVPDERIVRFTLAKRNGAEVERFVLVSELTGKSANIILTDNEAVVLDALKHFPAGSVRTVEPGVALDPLPAMYPVGKMKAGELIPRQAGESWNEAADRFYSALVGEETETLERGELGRAIKKAFKKAERKLVNLEGDRKKAEEGLGCYKFGELLISNLRAFKRGTKEVELVDYTETPPVKVTVPLDEKLSPRENADKYFKRAKKSKTGLALLKDRIPEAEREIEYLGNLLYELEAAETEEDLAMVKDELREGGYIKEVREKKAKEKKAKAEGGASVRRYTSVEGFEVLCGKSGRGNDMIVQKLARGEDIWFHAHRVPGSHVLIKVAGRGKELTRRTIEEAASLAAWHSKARGEMKVEVCYTEARNVRKPKGAKPGLVTIKDFKTVRVKPGEMA